MKIISAFIPTQQLLVAMFTILMKVIIHLPLQLMYLGLLFLLLKKELWLWMSLLQMIVWMQAIRFIIPLLLPIPEMQRLLTLL